jgi:hypothetical protein
VGSTRKDFMRYCLNCNKETKNPKFCELKCSASYNNRKFPKRKNGKKCIKCFAELPTKRKYCDDCSPNIIDWSTVTYKEVTDKRKHQKNSRIRNLARAKYNKSSKPKLCTNCGYDKHYEVCHIKPINSFSEDSLVSEINHLDNLKALCPNCHWELDNL